MRPPLHTLKIWGAGVYSPRSYGSEFVFFLVRERSALATLIFTSRVCLSVILLVRERSALATLIYVSVCPSVILSVRNFGAKYLGNEAR